MRAIAPRGTKLTSLHMIFTVLMGFGSFVVTDGWGTVGLLSLTFMFGMLDFYEKKR